MNSDSDNDRIIHSMVQPLNTVFPRLSQHTQASRAFVLDPDCPTWWAIRYPPNVLIRLGQQVYDNPKRLQPPNAANHVQISEGPKFSKCFFFLLRVLVKFFSLTAGELASISLQHQPFDILIGAFHMFSHCTSNSISVLLGSVDHNCGSNWA
jgi:hypothetical protein